MSVATARVICFCQGFNASAERVRAILESEKAKGKDPSRMVVGGFSQGGAVALHVCLRSTEPLAGWWDGTGLFTSLRTCRVPCPSVVEWLVGPALLRFA